MACGPSDFVTAALAVLAQGALRLPGGKPPDLTAWNPRWPAGQGLPF
jgi:hypothetical protein